jgi:hypothetical protein
MVLNVLRVLKVPTLDIFARATAECGLVCIVTNVLAKSSIGLGNFDYDVVIAALRFREPMLK